MTDVFHDRVKESGTGTSGAITLTGAFPQYQSFAAVGNGNSCRYTVLDVDGVQWGSFGGVWSTGGSLSRVTTYESSNGVGVAVTFGAGSHTVFLTPDSTSLAFVENANVFTGASNQFSVGQVYQGSLAGQTAVVADLFTPYGPSVPTFVAQGQDVPTFYTARGATSSGAPWTAGLLCINSRGTLAAPTALQSGDDLGEIDFAGYNGTNYVYGASIIAKAGATPDTDVQLALNTFASGGAIQYRAALKNGLWGLGDNTGSVAPTSPAIKGGAAAATLAVRTYNDASDAPLSALGLTLSGLTASNWVLTDASKVLISKTNTQATALLDNMVGDSGAGGTKGLVPAPAAGDAAAGKFLKADGSWATAGAGGGATTALDNLASVAINAALVLGTSDAFALGSATKQWSDLFLAEGAVINWDGGDATITQTANDITVAGITTFGVGTGTAVGLGTVELGHATDTTLSRVSAGVLAVEGVNVLLANHSPGPPCGRLTLTTAVPVTTADVTGATTIFYTPYVGNTIPLWDGTRWALTIFTEVSLALGTLTSGLPYDVFGFLNAGALNTELLAWTNTTTRATAITFQDGMLCKSGDHTRLWLGTFYTTATTTTEDSVTKRYVWNMYNQVQRQLKKSDNTSHTYGSATTRQWNNTAADKVELVLGNAFTATINFWGNHQYSAAGNANSGIGVDSTTVSETADLGTYFGGLTVVSASAINSVALVAGYHYIAMLEQAGGATNQLFNSALLSFTVPM